MPKQSYKSTLLIDGKAYQLRGYFLKKKDADIRAKELRKQGKWVRVKKRIVPDGTYYTLAIRG